MKLLYNSAIYSVLFLILCVSVQAQYEDDISFEEVETKTITEEECGSKTNRSTIKFPGFNKTFLLPCGASDAQIQNAATAACLGEIGSSGFYQDHVTGNKFGCGPCLIKDACLVEKLELRTGARSYKATAEHILTFYIGPIEYCLYKATCPGKKWRAKWNCSKC